MRAALVLLVVAVVAAPLAFTGLGRAPFIDPPEGFHAEIARGMAARAEWVTPRLNGVRYFDKPPLPYWLMAASFGVAGPTPGAARVWGAVALVGVAVATAGLGVALRGPRLGLLAGLIVTSNLGLFLYARIVKPDLLFVFFIVLAWTGLALGWLAEARTPGGRADAATARGPRLRAGLVVFYVSLGLAAITKDFLGAVGPLAVLALTLVWIREPLLRRCFPWWGLVLLAGVALPWYVAVEAQNRGFLWYTVVDDHLLNFARQRAFPDEDVPLGSLEFLLVTAAAFLPWTLALPLGVVRAVRGRVRRPPDMLWRLFALWSLAVIGLFVISPFKLPHYGLPAFPALALLAARAWDDALAGPRRVRRIVAPTAAVFGLLALAFGALSLGVVRLGAEHLGSVDVATRNLAARGQPTTVPLGAAWQPIATTAALTFAGGTVVLGLAAWRRAGRLGAVTTVGAMLVFLPAAGLGMAGFADARSPRAVVQALVARARPTDLVVHEGALENSGSVLLALDRPVRVVNGLASSLAYGATFRDGRDVFWDEARLVGDWGDGRRRFLVSVVAPERSVVRRLPAERLHLIARSATHWLYSNIAD